MQGTVSGIDRLGRHPIPCLSSKRSVKKEIAMIEPEPRSEPVVRYERRGPTALVTMDRPQFRNAQNSQMTYALDDAFYRAAADDEVGVIVLAGAGGHFSAGHDIGTPAR